MSQKLRNQLKELGPKLETPPASKDALLKLLKQAATCLSELDQSPSKSVLGSIQPFLNAVVKPELLKHQDRDVKLLVATCVCEITRITAPEAPYSDDVLRDIFRLIVSTFSGLGDINGPSFGRRVIILETLARYKSCVVMLDLECDDLVNEMFRTFFAVARDDHPESVLTSMQTIMILLLEESEDIEENLLVTLLSVLGRAKNDVPMAARKLAMNVIENCAGKLEPCIKQFLISSMTGDSSSLTSHLDYHEVIFDIFRCAPQILSGVIPYLTGELLADELDTRLKAVKLLGDLFALPDCEISEAFQSIFSEFLKRLSDRAVEVRMSAIKHVKSCLLSNPLRPESPEIIAALCDRLLDYDENVRKEVVAAVCDVACCSLKSIPVETVGHVAERLRDKSLLVKRYTMERIAEIYRLYCSKCSDGSMYGWIPGKILRCFYDKDVRAETIEVVLCGSLFPKEFSNKDKVKHWVTIFSGFDKVEIKALEKILEQKQRLQQEMQKYLSLRQMMHKDADAPELQKKILLSFWLMSRWFIDPVKAEEDFQILDQLKDSNVWKILSALLDSSTSFQQAWEYRDNLLKILGEKHPLYDFLGTLSMKCSYLLFNKEFVKEILLEVTTEKFAGNAQHVQSCMNLLVILAQFSPSLLSGSEEDILSFLREDDEIIKEGALRILGRAGGTIREQLAVTSSPVDLILERLCLEGSRKQAKYAVHALVAITKDDGLMSLSIIYKRLVDMLAEKSHFPAILQSLGCIAQTAMPVFETRESEIVGLITSSILECSNKAEDNTKTSWDDRSELCLLKIYGLKTLVKSYLPVKDAHLRRGIENFLGILKNILLTGEISTHVNSSPVDRAHMKLAAAKAILRLSKHWDHKIPIEIFHLILRTSEISYPQAKKQFLGKVMQYVKDRLLDVKYACTFLFNITQSQTPEFEEEKHNLVEVIQMCDQAKARQLPMQCDANPLMNYPEYILPYLVHALAHHSSFPNIDKQEDVKAIEPIYRQLHLFLSVLVHGEEDGKSDVINGKEQEKIATAISIFQSIKHSEDVLDVTKTKNSYAACDLGLSITKNLAKKQDDLTGPIPSMPLPSALYKPLEKKDGDDSLGNDEPSWLTSASVLAQLESLVLRPNGTLAEDENNLGDSDKDGNDMPLGQMLKKIKAEGNKSKKVGKKKVVPPEVKNSENDFDILGMVREINLDNLEKSRKLESGNGHVLSGENDDHSNDEKISVSRKRKRRKRGDTTSVAVPKRKRSSSAHNVHKSSQTWSKLKDSKKDPREHSPDTDLPSSQSADEEASAEFKDKMIVEKETKEPFEKDLLASCLVTKKSSPSKAKRKSMVNHNSDIEHNSDAGDAEPKMPIEQPVKSSNAPIKKRKRRSIAGLAKCSSKEGEEHELVGCRINVWWPLDEQFYEGLVQSYDSVKKKHKILYNDGDVEVLNLDKERWELLTNGHSPKKLLKLPNISSTKSTLPKQPKSSRTPRSLPHNKKSNKKSSSSRVRRKATPKKGFEKKQNNNPESKPEAASDDESGGASDLSNSEPVVMPEADDENSGDSARKQVEEKENILTDSEDDKEDKSNGEGRQKGNEGVSQTDSQVSNKEDKSDSEEKQVEETEKSQTEEIEKEQKSDSEGSEKEEKSDSKGPQKADGDEEKPSDARESEEDGSDSEGKEEDLEKSSTALEKPVKKKSKPSNSSATEDSDDEPLETWKRRAGKGKAL